MCFAGAGGQELVRNPTLLKIVSFLTQSADSDLKFWGAALLYNLSMMSGSYSDFLPHSSILGLTCVDQMLQHLLESNVIDILARLLLDGRSSKVMATCSKTLITMSTKDASVARRIELDLLPSLRGFFLATGETFLSGNVTISLGLIGTADYLRGLIESLNIFSSNSKLRALLTEDIPVLDQTLRCLLIPFLTGRAMSGITPAEPQALDSAGSDRLSVGLSVPRGSVLSSPESALLSPADSMLSPFGEGGFSPFELSLSEPDRATLRDAQVALTCAATRLARAFALSEAACIYLCQQGILDSVAKLCLRYGRVNSVAVDGGADELVDLGRQSLILLSALVVNC